MEIFLRKLAIISDNFKVLGSPLQTLGAATEKARLPKLSLSFWNNKLLSVEIDRRSPAFVKCLSLSV